jgi:hypothetical protein
MGYEIIDWDKVEEIKVNGEVVKYLYNRVPYIHDSIIDDEES